MLKLLTQQMSACLKMKSKATSELIKKLLEAIVLEVFAYSGSRGKSQ